jgi:hypothetical protein
MTAPQGDRVTAKATKKASNGVKRGDRVGVLKLRISNRELAAWRRAAEATCEGNVSRYVREVVNTAIAKPREPAEVKAS